MDKPVMTADQFALQCAALDLKDARITHADFARSIKTICIDKFLHRHEKLELIESRCDIFLCNFELEKSNG